MMTTDYDRDLSPWMTPFLAVGLAVLWIALRIQDGVFWLKGRMD